jgi:hypothetical protein
MKFFPKVDTRMWFYVIIFFSKIVICYFYRVALVSVQPRGLFGNRLTLEACYSVTTYYYYRVGKLLKKELHYLVVGS